MKSPDRDDSGLPPQKDRELLREFRLKRLQRSIEYFFLLTIFLFFLLGFYQYYSLWFALVLFVAVAGMNLQLTRLRETRRTRAPEDRERIKGDVIESLIFLALILISTIGSLGESLLSVSTEEYYGYLAAGLCGLFVGAAFGEVRYQLTIWPELPAELQRNYIQNLRRTVILPYLSRSRRRK